MLILARPEIILPNLPNKRYMYMYTYSMHMCYID